MESSSASEEYVSQLRLELKAWERDFSARNAGRKAGRDDIKQDEIIAGKYKEYNRLRSANSSKPPQSPSQSRQPSKPKDTPKQLLGTPRVSRKLFQKQNAPPLPPSSPSPQGPKPILSPSKDPAAEAATTPSHPRVFFTSVGPTPQKNGRVLGLFDLLSSGEPTPPSHRRRGADLFSPTRAALTEASGRMNVLVTPSATRYTDAGNAKPAHDGTPVKAGAENGAEEDPEEIMTGRKRKWARTPGSGNGGRFWMDLFVTPGKRRKLFDAEMGAVGETPRKEMGGETPRFLRRDQGQFEGLDAVTEEDDGAEVKSPEVVVRPWKRGLRRTVSSVVERLRRVEQERKVDEEERARREDSILREVEAGWEEEEEKSRRTQEGVEQPTTAVGKQTEAPHEALDEAPDEVPDEVPDEGPDEGPEEASDEEPQPEEDYVDMVPETQDIFATKSGEEDRFDEDLEAAEDPRPEDTSQGFVRKKKGQKRQTKRVISKSNHLDSPICSMSLTISHDSDDLEDGAGSENGSAYGDEEIGSDAEHAKDTSKPKLKSKKRTVNPLAHTNFRKLKIKNQNSKAKGRGRSPPALPTPTPIPSLIPVVTTSNTSPSTDSTPQKTTTPPSEPSTPLTMADTELQNIIRQLHQQHTSLNPTTAAQLLSTAKRALLTLNALLPSPSSSPQHLQAAREVLELGALISIRLQDADSFTRYFAQLQPFYAVPEARLPREGSQRSKITGLYLLLLLSQHDYAGFHTLLEGLEVEQEKEGEKGLENDPFVQYPIRLERALMEGSYDRVWGATKGENVPSEEFALFSGVLINTIRSEIASCSEKAYPSMPVSNAKNLFFLDSEGSVVQFAQERGWVVKDGRIFFPHPDQEGGSEKDILATSDKVIENTLGYARVLETIV
ncbi:hypothetical protein P152DRAFT_467566 [Eremomyces bilateralis CBS 781.70]|uniref:PCI domain-containing protein n=1 Tax=Eremomyces bilateralis CBS 781.70 TaxID=1392243 RepID=A0A6G1FYP7_9PEZI|nr:uncharacterized protein P152DRAFT_467566 [Eremomyces bilateralis CBS 781.70]KAF1810842.1 hypothetical protein P152DRAFT_467566 [Eremomyces bilateralis CBS 781.70]